MILTEIYKPIKKDLDKVEERLKTILEHKEDALCRLGRHVSAAAGKRLRPALVLLSAKTGRGNSSAAVDLAAAIELIHTATLIHDDIIDNASLRRNQPSLNVKFGLNNAILFGDYLFSRAFALICALNFPKITSILLATTRDICQGEMRQHYGDGRINFDQNDYIKTISDKTASLFSASCQTGAILSGCSPKQVKALKVYGQCLGIGFQIADDCLDLAGKEKKAGKTLGLDQNGKKLTLPMMYLNQSVKRSKKEAVRRSMETAKIYQGRALAAITELQPAEVKNSLKHLIGYTLKPAL